MSVAEAPPRCTVERMPEVVAQALSGLMAVHGRDSRRPRRLGLDIATSAATILAAQGSRAWQLARLRGLDVGAVETSTLDAALLFVAHHLAIATSGDPLRPISDGPGPPFPTSDGHWVEFEALTPHGWSQLWERLGVQRDVAAAAWSPFVLRYLAGSCSLPSALHEATARHDLARVREAAGAAGVELCRQRGYAEVLGDAPPAEPWTLSAGPEAPIGRTVAPPDATDPLAGILVVELATRLQGPLAGHLLSLLGATVVKVEPPGGDIGRQARSGFGWAAYRAYNARKDVVEIDVKQPGGRAELQALASTADVFLHNAPPGRAERFGFDARSLIRVNRSLVHAHASGWGPSGPTRIAGDFLVQAHAGCADGLTPASEKPRPSRVTLLDVTGGILACDAVLAGLVLRERRGCASAVRTSLLAAAGVLQRDVLRALAAGNETGRRGGRALWTSLDEPLKTGDGWLVAEPRDAAAVAAACGGLDRLGPWLRERSGARALTALSRAGARAAIVCDDLAALADDATVGLHLLTLDDGCSVPAAPWRFAAGGSGPRPEGRG